MSKVFIIHENGEWVEPLRRRLVDLGTPFEEWDLVEGRVPIDDVPPHGVFYNRMSASSYTRDHRFSPEFGAVVLSWLEASGRNVINDSRALSLEINKAAQYGLLKTAKIRTPKTIVAVGQSHIISAAEEFAGEPFILKPNRGGKGDGVRLFETIDDLKEYVLSSAYSEPVDGISLVQQYVYAPDQKIIRAEFIGGELFYEVEIKTGGNFELCPADVCQVPDVDQGPQFKVLKPGTGLQREVTGLLAKELYNSGVHVAGVEFIRDANETWYAYDINTNTNYNAVAEEEAGVYGMMRLAEYLSKQMEESGGQPLSTLQIAV